MLKEKSNRVDLDVRIFTENVSNEDSEPKLAGMEQRSTIYYHVLKPARGPARHDVCSVRQCFSKVSITYTCSRSMVAEMRCLRLAYP